MLLAFCSEQINILDFFVVLCYHQIVERTADMQDVPAEITAHQTAQYAAPQAEDHNEAPCMDKKREGFLAIARDGIAGEQELEIRGLQYCALLCGCAAGDD